MKENGEGISIFYWMVRDGMSEEVSFNFLLKEN